MTSAVLTAHQNAVAERVLAEESARRTHLVVALSGAHAYGFPSPDSDLDLKAIHIDPTRRLLGVVPGRSTFDRLEVLDGVEIDYTSNELQMVVLGLLQGNGNYLERVLGPHPLQTGPELASLREVVSRSLSRRLMNHYRGFASSQLREVQKSDTPAAKKVLYVLRTAVTGIHALRTGRVVTDLTELLDEYGLSEARSLVLAKRAGERTPLSLAERDRWLARLHQVIARLEAEARTSPLPDEPPNVAELEAWLLELRRARFDA
jgi:predicted nucleotidyltransferase